MLFGTDCEAPLWQVDGRYREHGFASACGPSIDGGEELGLVFHWIGPPCDPVGERGPGYAPGAFEARSRGNSFLGGWPELP